MPDFTHNVAHILLLILLCAIGALLIASKLLALAIERVLERAPAPPPAYLAGLNPPLHGLSDALTEAQDELRALVTHPDVAHHVSHPAGASQEAAGAPRRRRWPLPPCFFCKSLKSRFKKASEA